AGRIDGFWEERLEPWDMMAGILMVTEAGGAASRFDGSPLGLRADEIVATHGALHGPMLEVLRQDAAKSAAALSAGKTRCCPPPQFRRGAGQGRAARRRARNAAEQGRPPPAPRAHRSR